MFSFSEERKSGNAAPQHLNFEMGSCPAGAWVLESVPMSVCKWHAFRKPAAAAETTPTRAVDIACLVTGFTSRMSHHARLQLCSASALLPGRGKQAKCLKR